MSEPHELLNGLPPAQLEERLRHCCGSARWVQRMATQRPFGSWQQLSAAADDIWQDLDAEDYHEAFAQHPQIGADLDALQAKFASTQDWSAEEQKGVESAPREILLALQQGNLDYQAKFGYIFIVCATGKSAAQMLALLRERLGNAPPTELAIAAAEQAKITKLRLEKLMP